MRTCSLIAGLAILVGACTDPPDTSQTTQQLTTIANGSFETGDYAGWTLSETPPEATSSGTFGIAFEGQVIASGSQVHDFNDNIENFESSPGLPITYHATDGGKLALQLQSGPQDHRMFQTVDLSNCHSVLRWDMAYANHADQIGQTFDPVRQFFAINVRDPATDGVLATPFKLVDPAPLSVLAMTPFEADLSAFDGQTVTIDFEHQVQNNFFDIAWDNIRLECQQPPALGTPPLIDFGPVLVGSSLPKPFALDSIGQGDLTITGFDTASPFSVAANVPATLPPTQSLQATATFLPLAPGPVSGSIIVHSDDPGGDRAIPVKGFGLAPQITINSGVDFGNVPVGASSTKPLRVFNTGDAPLTVTSMPGVGPFDTTTALPVTIPAGSFFDFTVRFTPGASGFAIGTITVFSDGFDAAGGIAVTMIGTGTVAGASFDVSLLDFGDVLVGTSRSKAVLLTNTGGANLVVSSIATTAPYAVVAPTSFPITILPNQNISITVELTAPAPGIVTKDLVVTSNASTSPDVVTLTGRGIEPEISIDVDPLAFGNQRVGQPLTKAITVSNNGDADLTISAISAAAPFAIVSPSVPLLVGAHNLTSILVSFTPAAAGTVSDTLTITSDAGNGPTTTVGLTGTGVEPLVSLDVATLPFGNQRLNAPTAIHTVTLTNTGTSNLFVSSITTTAPFTVVSQATGIVLAPAESLPIDVTFTPSAIGVVQQDLVIQTDAAIATTTIPLTGTGTVATFDTQPTTLGFGDIRVGTASTAKPLTITNLGGGSLTINSIAAPAGIAVTGHAFPVGVLPGANVVFDVVYAPATASSLGGALTIATSVGNQDVPIAGNGVPAALTADQLQLDFSSVRLGEASAAQTVTLRNVTAAPIAIASAASRDPQFVLDPPPPTTPIGPDQTVTFAIRYVPGSSGAASSQIDITLAGATATEITVDVTGTGVGGGSGCNVGGGTSPLLGLILLGLLRRRGR